MLRSAGTHLSEQTEEREEKKQQQNAEEEPHTVESESGSTYLLVSVVEARGLAAANSNGSSRPYAVVQFDSVEKKTRVLEDTVSPSWHAHFIYSIEPSMPTAKTLLLMLFSYESLMSDTLLGKIEIDLPEGLPLNKPVAIDQWYPVQAAERTEQDRLQFRQKSHLRSVSRVLNPLAYGNEGKLGGCGEVRLSVMALDFAAIPGLLNSLPRKARQLQLYMDATQSLIADMEQALNVVNPPSSPQEEEGGDNDSAGCLQPNQGASLSRAVAKAMVGVEYQHRPSVLALGLGEEEAALLTAQGMMGQLAHRITEMQQMASRARRPSSEAPPRGAPGGRRRSSHLLEILCAPKGWWLGWLWRLSTPNGVLLVLRGLQCVSAIVAIAWMWTSSSSSTTTTTTTSSSSSSSSSSSATSSNAGCLVGIGCQAGGVGTLFVPWSEEVLLVGLGLALLHGVVDGVWLLLLLTGGGGAGSRMKRRGTEAKVHDSSDNEHEAAPVVPTTAPTTPIDSSSCSFSFTTPTGDSGILPAEHTTTIGGSTTSSSADGTSRSGGWSRSRSRRSEADTTTCTSAFAVLSWLRCLLVLLGLLFAMGLACGGMGRTRLRGSAPVMGVLGTFEGGEVCVCGVLPEDGGAPAHQPPRTATRGWERAPEGAGGVLPSSTRGAAEEALSSLLGVF